MNKLMLTIVFCLAFTSAQAQALRVVEVDAPAINCLFNPTCKVVVSDTTDTIPIPAGGSNFLQTRTYRSDRGSPAAGLYVYEYRIDLRRAKGILNIPCLNSLSIDFGRVANTLDFDGNGEPGDEVFVVTRGGLGNVGLASAEKSGNRITFNFRVCAGGRPDAGESTFFFGLLSRRSPAPTTATILENTGKTYEVQARAPRQKDPLQENIEPDLPFKRPVPIPNRRNTKDANPDQSVPIPKDGNNKEADIDQQGPIPNIKRARALPTDAVVDRIEPRPCVDIGGRVTIYGSRFGRFQGTRQIELGGHHIGVLLKVLSWSDRRIIALVQRDRRIEQGQWYFIGLQDRDRNWISNISQTISICRGLE